MLLFFKKEALAFCCLALAAASPHSKTEAERQLRAAEQARQATLDATARASQALAAAQAEAARLAAQRARAAADLRVIEAQVIDAAGRLQAARGRSAEADATLAKRQADLARILPIMVRLARFPAETVLAVPLPPGQALEGLLITRGLSAQLEQEARALREQQALAETLRAAVAVEAAALARRRAAQMAAAAALDRQIAAAGAGISDAERQVAAGAQHAAALAAEAETLRGAIAAMDAARGKPDAGIAASRAVPTAGAGHGSMVTPVAGPVLRAWGSPAEDGPATGVTFGTAPGAFVSSPCAGTIAFAAPFRSYGRLLIIECGGGYDVVLAGLNRLDAAVGRSVRAGEPVGRMADYNAARQGNRSGPAMPGPYMPGAYMPGLYMEVRSAGLGQPQDPALFLKGRG